MPEIACTVSRAKRTFKIGFRLSFSLKMLLFQLKQRLDWGHCP